MSKPKIEREENFVFSDDVIKERLGKYGAVYFPSDIKETVDDIL